MPSLQIIWWFENILNKNMCILNRYIVAPPLLTKENKI